MIKAFVNYHKFSKFQNSSDISYAKYFKGLENENLQIVYNESRISCFIADLSITLSRSRRLRKYRLLKRLLFFWSRHTIVFPWQLKNIDIVITHWFFPILLSNKRFPLLFSSAFVSNEYAGATSDEERMNDIGLRKGWYAKSDVVSFCAQSWIKHFNSIDNTFEDKIIFLPRLLPNTNPISLEEIEQKFNNPEKINILFVGRDGERKGLSEFLEALAEISYLPELVDKIFVTVVTETKFNRPKNIEMEIYLPLENCKIVKLMHKAHIFCLPTHRDSYGLVFIEAMSSGCAVIADKRIPRTEFFQDGDCGVLIENSKDGVLIALKRLIEDSEFSKSLALRALKRFNSVYSFEKAKQDYLKVIENL